MHDRPFTGVGSQRGAQGEEEWHVKHEHFSPLYHNNSAPHRTPGKGGRTEGGGGVERRRPRSPMMPSSPCFPDPPRATSAAEHAALEGSIAELRRELKEIRDIEKHVTKWADECNVGVDDVTLFLFISCPSVRLLFFTSQRLSSFRSNNCVSCLFPRAGHDRIAASQTDEEDNRQVQT